MLYLNALRVSINPITREALYSPPQAFALFCISAEGPKSISMWDRTPGLGFERGNQKRPGRRASGLSQEKREGPPGSEMKSWVWQENI